MVDILVYLLVLYNYSGGAGGCRDRHACSSNCGTNCRSKFSSTCRRFVGRSSVLMRRSSFRGAIIGLVCSRRCSIMRVLLSCYPSTMRTTLRSRFNIGRVTPVMSCLRRLSGAIDNVYRVYKRPIYTSRFCFPPSKVRYTRRRYIENSSNRGSCRVSGTG